MNYYVPNQTKTPSEVRSFLEVKIEPCDEAETYAEHRRQICRKSYHRNKHKLKNQQRVDDYQYENRERLKEYRKRYYAENRERLLKAKQEYRKRKSQVD